MTGNHQQLAYQMSWECFVFYSPGNVQGSNLGHETCVSYCRISSSRLRSPSTHEGRGLLSPSHPPPSHDAVPSLSTQPDPLFAPLPVAALLLPTPLGWAGRHHLRAVLCSQRSRRPAAPRTGPFRRPPTRNTQRVRPKPGPRRCTPGCRKVCDRDPRAPASSCPAPLCPDARTGRSSFPDSAVSGRRRHGAHRVRPLASPSTWIRGHQICNEQSPRSPTERRLPFRAILHERRSSP